MVNDQFSIEIQNCKLIIANWISYVSIRFLSHKYMIFLNL
jgi:hypothetical protein